MKVAELIAPNLLRELLDTGGKMSYWDLVEKLGVEDAAEKIHDAGLPWFNHTMPSAINKMLKVSGFKTVSHAKLYMKQIVKETNYGKPVLTMSGYLKALEQELPAWRGGGGEYDPDKYTRSWTSFTLSESRVKTFSEYDGTYATREFMLDRRHTYWVVKLSIKIKDILLYLPDGYDEEIIVPVSLAKKAELIKQHKADRK